MGLRDTTDHQQAAAIIRCLMAARGPGFTVDFRLAVLVSAQVVLVLVLVVVDGPRTYQPWEGAQVSKVPQYPSTLRTQNGWVADMNLPAEQ